MLRRIRWCHFGVWINEEGIGRVSHSWLYFPIPAYSDGCVDGGCEAFRPETFRWLVSRWLWTKRLTPVIHATIGVGRERKVQGASSTELWFPLADDSNVNSLPGQYVVSLNGPFQLSLHDGYRRRLEPTHLAVFVIGLRALQRIYVLCLIVTIRRCPPGVSVLQCFALVACQRFGSNS